MKLHRNAKTTPTSRLELVRRTVDDGWRYQAVAEGYGVSVRTVAKWVQRFRQLGAALLHEDPLPVGRLGPRFWGPSAGVTLQG